MANWILHKILFLLILGHIQCKNDDLIMKIEDNSSSSVGDKVENGLLYCNMSETSQSVCDHSREEIATSSSLTNWLYCDKRICKSCNIPNHILQCNSCKNLSILTSNCVTFDEKEGLVEAGFCIYNYGNIHRSDDMITAEDNRMHFLTSVPTELSQLNGFMCGTLFNRTGTLCGKCKDGYYPLVYSFDTNCILCPYHRSNWWKFVLAAFLPLSVFYFIVLFCRLNITSSHLYGFVWYSQQLFTPPLARALIVTLKNKPIFQVLVRFFGVLCGIWNLDFFRSTNLGICLETDSLQIEVLDLAVGMYPLLLMVLTYLLINLYDRNFRPLVFVWKPFSTLFNVFVRNWEIKTSLIDAFATFFLLFNVKILSICANLLTPVVVYSFNSTGCYNHNYKLYNDATVPYFGERHLPYAILGIVVLLLFVVLPMLLLMLYPFHWFQNVLNFFPVRWYILHTFMDSFQGCYKDGTQPGTQDCRWFASLFLWARFITFLIGAYTPTLMFYPLSSMLLILFTILLITVQPYKTNVSHYADINAIFILLLVLFNACCIGLQIADEKRHVMVQFLLTASLAGILPLLYISIIILRWLYNHRKFGLELTRRLHAWKYGYNILE